MATLKELRAMAGISAATTVAEALKQVPSRVTAGLTVSGTLIPKLFKQNFLHRL